jgi:hypothetical protein
MTKPLPNCHFCKKTLVRKGKIIFTFHGKKFAWHPGECAKKDPNFEIACKVFAGKMDESEGVAKLEGKR